MKIHDNPHYDELIKQIEQYHIDFNLEAIKSTLDILQPMSEKDQDDIGISASYFYRALLAKYNKDISLCKTFLKKALQISQAKGIPYYEMKCYNSLSNLDLLDADYYSCLRNMMNTYEIATRHPEYKYEVIITNNIGILFAWLSEYDLAINFLEKSYHEYCKHNLNDDPLKANILISLAEMYSAIKDYDKASYWLDIHPELFNEEHIRLVDNIRLVNKILQNFDKKEYQMTLHYIHEFLKNADTPLDYGSDFRRFLFVFSISISLHEQALCEKLISIMDKLNKKSGIESFDFDYADAKLRYTNEFLPLEDNLQSKCYVEYYQKSKHTIDQFRQYFSRIMMMEGELVDYRQKNEMLEKNIELDIFTNIYNKVSLEKYVAEKLHKFKKNTKHAMFLIDIDHFKKINDIYGHNYGDNIISSVAQIISSIAKEKSVPGRFGGDEFMLYLFESPSISDIDDIAMYLMKECGQIELPDEQVKKVTLSIGIATVSAQMTFAEVFKSADKALYIAKAQGRNRYIVEPA